MNLPNLPSGNINGLYATHGIFGPWQCESCGNLSQFADINSRVNRIFCRNEACRYERIIDKKACYIVENDGTHWKFDDEGNKVRVR